MNVPFDSETLLILKIDFGAKRCLILDYKLVYEPEASVYHYHGIHQDGDVERCNNVVRIIQDMQSIKSNDVHLDPKTLNIVAVIPVKGEDWQIDDKPQMSLYYRSSAKIKIY